MERPAHVSTHSTAGFPGRAGPAAARVRGSHGQGSSGVRTWVRQVGYWCRRRRRGGGVWGPSTAGCHAWQAERGWGAPVGEAVGEAGEEGVAGVVVHDDPLAHGQRLGRGGRHHVAHGRVDEHPVAVQAGVQVVPRAMEVDGQVTPLGALPHLRAGQRREQGVHVVDTGGGGAASGVAG